jgi:aminocarboxymuconate-semialdehyde decarboxylase
MVIDIFTHVFPKSIMERVEAFSPNYGYMGSSVRNMVLLHDMDRRFRDMDVAGDYAQIISMASPPFDEIATSPKQATDLTKASNDVMADLVRRHPDRFPGFAASLALLNVDSAMREMDRAINDLGAKGVQIYTDVKGRPLDDPMYQPVFAAMAAHGHPIWLHPTRTPYVPDYPTEKESTDMIWLLLGWPFATAVAMYRLVIAGVFERNPGLKIITHHMGGMIPFHANRLEGGILRAQRERAKAEAPGAGPHMRRAPIEALETFYGDTAMHGNLQGVRCGLDFFGASNSVFASDHPYGMIGQHLDMMDRLELEGPALRKIMSENAERLMRKASKGGQIGFLSSPSSARG